jgi:hypothetical protein
VSDGGDDNKAAASRRIGKNLKTTISILLCSYFARTLEVLAKHRQWTQRQPPNSQLTDSGRVTAKPEVYKFVINELDIDAFVISA